MNSPFTPEKIEFLAKCKKNPALQGVEIEMCRRNILYWFDNFAHTQNLKGFYSPEYHYVPFKLFDFQRELVIGLWQALQDTKLPIAMRKQPSCDVFIEKSRQMGISWLVCAVFFYAYNFHDYKIHMLSQKAEDVDKIGDVKSLFGKIRFIVDHTPSWMLSPGIKETGTVHNKYMTLTKPNGMGAITGETANQDAGRGGTYDAIFLDEMASMEHAYEINQACSQATKCRIFNSTPKGTQNEFYRMRDLAMSKKIRGYTLHWSEHPFYDEEWYKLECDRLDPVTIAQELDIDYRASVVGAVYPQFADGRVDIGTYYYDFDRPLYVSIDNSHGGNDNFAVLVFQEDLSTGIIYLIDSLQLPARTTPKQFASFLARKPMQGLDFTVQMTQFYTRWADYKNPNIFISDPYDTTSALGNSSIMEDFREFGIHLTVPTFEKGKRGNIYEQVRITQKLIPNLRINEGPNILFLDCIYNARWKMPTGQTTNFTPGIIHDGTSHFRTAFEYFALWYENDKKGRAKPMEQRFEWKSEYNPITGAETWQLVK